MRGFKLRTLAGRRTRAVAGGLCVGVLLAACGSSPSSGVAVTTNGTAGVAAGAHSSGAGLRLVKVGVFDQPTYVTGAPGDTGRLFVVQKRGRVVLLVHGRRASRPFLDISSIVGSDNSEQGLLSMAFAPDYARSGRFYVDYTGHNGDVHVEEYDRSAEDPNVADSASARAVLTIPHHQFPNHNGGQLQFGPEGDLYVGVGDGGSENDPENNGQNVDVRLGKLLRISPEPGGAYTIPNGNPFAAQAGKRPEIWAYGLRNPWRFSFDRRTGDLVIADVGQDQQEEIDFAPRGTGAGANYGWSIFEGRRRNKPGQASNAVSPVLVKLHSHGYCAIIGGYVVRDRSLNSLYGRYVYGDECNPQIRSVELSAGHATDDQATGLAVPQMSSFGQDALGRVYAVSLAGAVYRIAAG
jgi:glucose/arabinose dehydrogenase